MTRRSARLACIVRVLLGLLVVSQANSAFGQRTTSNVRSGTMALGGSVAFQIEHDGPSGRPSATGGQFIFAPKFGYFVAHGLELSGALSIEVPFGDKYDNWPNEFGLMFGLRYVLGLGGRVSPYFGASLGPSWSFPEQGDTQTFFALAMPIGILVALNSWVAVDIAMVPKFEFGLSDAVKGTYIRLPIGYLGIDARF